MIRHGNCLEILPTLPAASVDAIVTDPPYGLSFMGREWDHGVPGVPFWIEALRVAKPGAYLAAFGGTRTHHRLMVAIEDAGWEIRDCLMWLYGSGFPKAKTCLKPAWEPVVLARKPGKALPFNVDACRIEAVGRPARVLDAKRTDNTAYAGRMDGSLAGGSKAVGTTDLGRWPANLLLDEASAALLDAQTGNLGASVGGYRGQGRHGTDGWGMRADADRTPLGYGDSGGASRFFYCAKASRKDRGPGNTHPTVKPSDLMRWLVRLVTPPGGLVLDPFAGSGTTGVACEAEGHRFLGIELEAPYVAIAQTRVIDTSDPFEAVR